jgi:hypothetical protein
MGDTLDFLVIGAQRAGTTSLWRHLQSHPEIYVPPSKEAPFFSHDEPFHRGLQWYLGEFFADADPGQRWGTVSPHYMMGSPDADVPEVARRIHTTVPKAKLIAILRDPIERAQSHHRMVVHRGREERAFDEAAREMLKPDLLRRAREEPPLVQPYLVQGEYGRILSTYLDVFPRDQLHVLMTSDLDEAPMETMRAIFRFLGADEDHRAPDLEVHHHRGGRGRRLDSEAEESLKAHLAREVWPQTSQPAQQRRAFDFWFLQWNVLTEEEFPPVDPVVRTLLEDHYARDTEILEAAVGLKVPWSRPVQVTSVTAAPIT